MNLNSVVDENTTIYRTGSMIYYIRFNRIIEDLTWNKGEEDYLTLKEIAEQVKYFQSEVFELNEAIFEKEKIGAYPGIEERKHIAEEIADVLNMVEQFMYYYGIDIQDVIEIKHQKIHRQLERIK